MMIHPDVQRQWEEDCMKWRGKVLTGQKSHWCYEWDGLPIDETCEEYPCCSVADDESERNRR